MWSYYEPDLYPSHHRLIRGYPPVRNVHQPEARRASRLREAPGYMLKGRTRGKRKPELVLVEHLRDMQVVTVLNRFSNRTTPLNPRRFGGRFRALRHSEICCVVIWSGTEAWIACSHARRECVETRSLTGG